MTGVRSFVGTFFTCTACRTHFMEMASTCGPALGFELALLCSVVSIACLGPSRRPSPDSCRAVVPL